jgi:hypothetical protein
VGLREKVRIYSLRDVIHDRIRVPLGRSLEDGEVSPSVDMLVYSRIWDVIEGRVKVDVDISVDLVMRKVVK